MTLPWCFLKHCIPTGLWIVWDPCWYRDPKPLQTRWMRTTAGGTWPRVSVNAPSRFSPACSGLPGSSLSVCFTRLTHTRLIFQSITLITSFPWHLKMGYRCPAAFSLHIPEHKTFSNLASTYFPVMSPVTHKKLVVLHHGFLLPHCTPSTLPKHSLGSSFRLPLTPSLSSGLCHLEHLQLRCSIWWKFSSSSAPSSEASSPMTSSFLEVLFPSSQNL